MALLRIAVIFLDFGRLIDIWMFDCQFLFGKQGLIISLPGISGCYLEPVLGTYRPGRWWANVSKGFQELRQSERCRDAFVTRVTSQTYQKPLKICSNYNGPIFEYGIRCKKPDQKYILVGVPPTSNHFSRAGRALQLIMLRAPPYQNSKSDLYTDQILLGAQSFARIWISITFICVLPSVDKCTSYAPMSIFADSRQGLNR